MSDELVRLHIQLDTLRRSIGSALKEIEPILERHRDKDKEGSPSDAPPEMATFSSPPTVVSKQEIAAALEQLPTSRLAEFTAGLVVTVLDVAQVAKVFGSKLDPLTLSVLSSSHRSVPKPSPNAQTMGPGIQNLPEFIESLNLDIHDKNEFSGSSDNPLVTQFSPGGYAKDMETYLCSVTSFCMSPKFVTTSSVVHHDEEDGWSKLNKYTILGEVGRGSQGKVILAVPDDSDELVVLKVVSRGKFRQWRAVMAARAQQDEESASSSTIATFEHSNSDAAANQAARPLSIEIQREIAVMKQLHHKNLAQLLEVIDDPHEDRLFLVMPYYDRGPVLHFSSQFQCTPLDTEVMRTYVQQLCRAVHFLHTHNIIHCDIKPDNVLVGNDGLIRLSDFGLSRAFPPDEKPMTWGGQGTPMFMPPEALASQLNQVDGKALDMWGVGVTLFAMLCGSLPFSGATFDEVRKSVIDTVPVVSVAGRTELSDDEVCAADLVLKLLEKNSEKRLTIRQCRLHPFLKGNDRPQRIMTDTHSSLHQLFSDQSSVDSPPFQRLMSVTDEECRGAISAACKSFSKRCPPEVPRRLSIASTPHGLVNAHRKRTVAEVDSMAKSMKV